MGSQTNKSAISRSASSALKVIFEMMVLFHHLYLVHTSFFSHISGLAGPVAVGGFLILSGYGVGMSYKKSGEEYSKKLLFKRIPSTYLMLLIVDICYLALYYYTGSKFDNAFDLIISVLYIPIFDGFVALSHYVYFLADLIVYYFIFLLFSYLFRKQKNRLLIATVCISALTIVIIIVLSIINASTGSERYLRACVCFPIGLLIACFDDIICEFLDNYKWLVAITFFVLGFAFYVSLGTKTVTEYVTPALFSLSIITMVYGANSKSKLLDYFAKLILYIYVSHEFFREWFLYQFPNEHRNVRGLIVIGLSVVLSVIVNALVTLIGKKIKQNRTEKIQKNA